MSIASKLEYLDQTKNYIRQCIQQKGVTVPATNTFREFGDRILEINTEKHPDGWGGEGGDTDYEGKLTVGTATATGQDYVLSPPYGYEGFSSVNVTGDPNLKPENIAEGITIYGVTGKMTVPSNTTNIPPEYLDLFEQARQQWGGDYDDLMILESDEAVAFGFMLNGFTVKSYDDNNTEFTASRWVYVAFNKATRQWKVENWETGTSNGNSYVKNIRYCSRYLYYGTRLIYPFSGSGVTTTTPSDNTFVFTCTVGSFYKWNTISEGSTDSKVLTLSNSIGFMYVSPLALSISLTCVEDSNVKSTASSHIYHTLDSRRVYLYYATYDAAHSGKRIRVTAKGSPTLLFKLKRVVSFDTALPPSLIALSLYPKQDSSHKSDGSDISPETGMFESSSNITLPSNLFSHLDTPNITNINNLFYKSTIKSIPGELFSDLKNLQLAEHVFCHEESIEYLPEKLFYGLTEIYSMYYVCYYMTKLQSIPSGFFSTNVNLENLQYAFGWCTLLQYIPAGLLSNLNNLTNCSYMFYNCSSLRRLENSIWPSNQKKSLNMSYMFRLCEGLIEISESFFSGLTRVSSVAGMFSGCTSITGYLPELWNTEKFGTTFTSASHSECFKDCVNARNYSSVPTGWK